jgi:dimethylamine monooxygenase subunit A
VGADFAFHFAHIAVPFAMRPGLARLPDNACPLTSLRPGSKLFIEKKKIFEANASRHCMPGFDPSPAIDSIAARSGNTWATGSFDEKLPLETAFEEDFAVLDGDTGTLPWLCVCVPSHWAPEDKLGLHFDAVHQRCRRRADALLAASAQLVQLVTAGACWQRYVWTISPSPRYDQHPRRHARAAWPDAADAAQFAAHCFLRAERQTFFPVGRGTRQAVFAIRVMLQRLPVAVDNPENARRLHDSLASMSDAVLAYKGLHAAREPLLRWLKTCAA